MTDKTTVLCSHRGGLQLRLYREHHLEKHMGPRVPDPTRGTVELKYGSNEVDKDFMDAWLEENRDKNDMLSNGTISIQEKQPDAGGKPGEDTIVERSSERSSIDAPAPKQTSDAE